MPDQQSLLNWYMRGLGGALRSMEMLFDEGIVGGDTFARASANYIARLDNLARRTRGEAVRRVEIGDPFNVK